MFSKKGSLEIGINTIVILVIAMVLLGLGIGFIRNLFQNAGELPELIDTDQLGTQPTSSDPILISPSAIEVKAGDSKEVRVGVYNNKETSRDFEITVDQCMGPANNQDIPSVQSLRAQIASGESRGFKVIVTAEKYDDALQQPSGDDMVVGKYICNMQAVLYEEDSTNEVASYGTQFILTVVT